MVSILSDNHMEAVLCVMKPVLFVLIAELLLFLLILAGPETAELELAKNCKKWEKEF